tara:strand:- start:5794 stop:6591 length:798 start_codon:yes stop_codon:yes gene_type:complete
MKQEAKNTDQGSISKVETKLPSNIMEQHAGAGMENLSPEDLSMPFLKILMPLSPQVNKSDNRYIEGAQPGMILNSATKKVYDGEKGILVVPVHYERKYLEWAERGSSVGRPIVHAEDTPLRNQTTRDKSYKDRLPNGNYLERTSYHFVILLNGIPTVSVITMKASQNRVSKDWMAELQGWSREGSNGLYNPPMFGHTYKLTCVPQSNAKGSWFGWRVTRQGYNEDNNLFKMGVDFSTKFKDGAIKTDINPEDTNSSEEIKSATSF